MCKIRDIYAFDHFVNGKGTQGFEGKSSLSANPLSPKQKILISVEKPDHSEVSSGHKVLLGKYPIPEHSY